MTPRKSDSRSHRMALMSIVRIILLPIIIVIVMLFPETLAHTQSPGSFDVFYSANVVKGKTGLFFVDARTGLSNSVAINGEQYTALTNGVLFRESDSHLIKIAYPDGRIELYTPMQPSGPNLRLEWAVSQNRKWIVWTTSRTEGQSLIGDTYLLPVGGQDKRQVLHSSSTNGVVTIPLAVTNDGSAIFYTRQGDPDPNAYQLFPAVADAYKLDVESGQSAQMPGEPKCACAAAFSADGKQFLRLETPDNQQGFNARLWDLTIKTDQLIGAPLQNAASAFRQAGYMLFSPDGRLAVYTAAHGIPPTKNSPERYFIVLVDVERREQRILTDPLISALRPVAFKSDNSAVLLAGTTKDGTYKVTLQDGDFLQVSAYSFLGTITG